MTNLFNLFKLDPNRKYFPKKEDIKKKSNQKLWNNPILSNSYI